jgi:hypothetical protein
MNWWPLVVALLGLPHSILLRSLISFHKPKIHHDVFHRARTAKKKEKKKEKKEKKKTPNPKT